jgi:DNA-binding MarR family transcriptional regulator
VPANFTRDDVPLWELIQTSWVVARGFTDVFAEAGLSPGQFGVLQALAEQDRLTQAELARQLMMRPQSVNEVVASLLHRDLVRRDGPAGRGRRAGLTLTALGRDTLRRAWPGVRAFNSPDATGLTAEETATLVHLLQTVRSTLTERA